MMNENMVKKLEMRKAVLKERIRELDSKIEAVRQAKIQTFAMRGGCHNDYVALCDEAWDLTVKRIDMQAEVDDIEYALNPRPYKAASRHDGCIYNSGDLDFNSEIRVKGFVLGVRL